MCGGLPREALKEAPGAHEVRDTREERPLVLVDIAMRGGVEKMKRVPPQERELERAYSGDEDGGRIEEREARCEVEERESGESGSDTQAEKARSMRRFD